MKATDAEIERLLARHGIAALGIRGGDSIEASRGGWAANLCITHSGGSDTLALTISGVRAEGHPPHDLADALSIVSTLRSQAAVPDDPSFEHMLADLLVKAAKVFEETEATKFELSSLRLHPTSYHIGKATLLHDKALHVKARLKPDTHDRHAVFSHRHGDSTEFPK
jgi:hypothetical protein